MAYAASLTAIPETNRFVLRSMSTPGAEGPRGFNELRIEDKAGAEEIYLHAEKDVEAHIKNDWREHVLRDKNRTVDGLALIHTLKETHEKLLGPRKTEPHADDNLSSMRQAIPPSRNAGCAVSVRKLTSRRRERRVRVPKNGDPQRRRIVDQPRRFRRRRGREPHHAGRRRRRIARPVRKTNRAGSTCERCSCAGSRAAPTLVSSPTTDRLWIDRDWVMASPHAHVFYKVFTNSLYEATPHILNAAARQKLGDILKRKGYLQDERTNFDFTSTLWYNWEYLHHTLISIPRRKEMDGLMVALAGFTLRALAAGHTEPLGGERWRITVTKVSVFAHDKFNFADDAGLGNYLGYWSCKELKGARPDPLVEKPYNYIGLKNEDFRAFREKRKHGVDFLVLSEAHPVSPFSERSYGYPC